MVNVAIVVMEISVAKQNDGDIKASLLKRYFYEKSKNHPTLPEWSAASPARRVPHGPHPRRTGCSCTRTNRAVPKIQDIPNRSHVCNFDFCIPKSRDRTRKTHW